MEIYLARLEIGDVGPTSGKPIRDPGRGAYDLWGVSEWFTVRKSMDYGKNPMVPTP